MTRQAYFVVYYDEESKTFYRDEDREMAVFHGEDIWDEDNELWDGIYEHATLYEEAAESLTKLLGAD